MLIKAGASANDNTGFWEKFGKAPLWVACKKKNESLVNDLISAGAKVNILDQVYR